MTRLSFFWKLYATYAAGLLATTIAIGALTDLRLSQSLEQGLQRSLLRSCELATPVARDVLRSGANGGAPDVRALAQAANVRLTVMRADGVVVADSHEDAARMENHRGRPEVLESLIAPYGFSRRRSRTVGESMFYCAKHLPPDGETTGFVRVALPLEQSEAELAALRRVTLLGGGVGVSLALLLGLFFARKYTAPVQAITKVAEDFRQERFDSRVRGLPPDELGLLGETLNRLGDEVTRRMATITKDDARLRAMLVGMVEGVVAVDEEDRVVFCNRAAAKLLGLDERRTIGTPIWEQLRVAELDRLLSEAREKGRASRGEVVVPREGGESVLQVHANPFRTSGASGVVAVFHDITELRRLELIRRDFVANVSHELKTPLTSIKGYVETLLSGAIHDEANNVRFLEKIDTHVGRLGHLVSDLLSLARIESQREGVPLVPVDWKQVTGEALRRHEAALRAKSLALDTSLAEVAVLGDRESITQVVDNLLDNAIKYTPAGGSVRVTLSSDREQGVLNVEDTGLGIPEEDLDRIFERFYRVDKARSREVGGTGLGLAIVKHLVQAMAGQVEVASRLGRGSRFTVRIPLVGARPLIES